MSRDDLTDDVLRALRRYEFKDRGDYLREGVCPACSKRSLWVRKDKPFVVRCDRLNRCGYERHAKELFPDLYESWSERHPSTPDHPHAAADAYLHHARGLTITGLREAYTQEQFFAPDINAGTATVRFPLPNGGWWERLIDRPWRFGKMKARILKGYTWAGEAWLHPADRMNALAAEPEIWIAEGVIDALSLRERGAAAISSISSSNYPSTFLAHLRRAVEERRAGEPTAKAPRIVFALDADKAGRAATRKHVDRARTEGWTAGAAQIPQPSRGKVDWNDLHLVDKLKPEDLDEYRWRGDLLLAASPSDYALLLHDRLGRASYPFTFQGRTWWASIDPAKLAEAIEQLNKQGWDPSPNGVVEDVQRAAARKVLKVAQIANCDPRPLYFQRDPLTDESWYFYGVEFPHDGPTAKNTFTPSQIASNAEFKKRLLSIAPLATFTGTTGQLDRLLDLQRERLRTVEALGFVGYSAEHRAYVFNDVAVQAGRILPVNDDDYVELAGGVAVKSVDRSVNLKITPWTKAPDLDWYADLYRAFGAKGLVALAFWFGSFFAEQLRERHASFPFLELSGEPNLGKSTIVEFLWKLCGRQNYEGFDPSKSTISARARNFAQVGNMPIVLMEGDRDDDTARAKKFDFDELKSLYNGRSVRSRGVRTSGNETYEPAFRGAIVIEQNHPVQGSDAIMTRIVQLVFDGAGYSGDTKRAADRLEALTVEHVSGFVLAAVAKEAEVLARIAEVFAGHEQALMETATVAHRRIAKCHAQLLACLDALRLVLPIGLEEFASASRLILAMAQERKLSIAADHPVVEEFWEAYDFIASRKSRSDYDDEPYLNHARAEDLIAVNLKEFGSIAAEMRVQTPDAAILKQHLRSSKVRKFQDVRDVNSARTGKTLHCWVFAQPPSR